MWNRFSVWFLQLFERDNVEREIQKLIAHVDEKNKDVYRIILANEFNYITNTTATSKTCPHCGKKIEADRVKQLLPRLVVKVLDNLIVARQFIGLQPLSGPVGLIYKLRFRNGTGQVKRSDVNVQTLELVSCAVEAGSRKLSAGWSMEVSEDLKAQHDIDVEEEILNAMADEITHEYFDEILNDLQHDVRDVQMDLWDGHKLSIEIINAANEIARKTRRGVGNFVIVNPLNLARLQGDERVKFEAASSEEAKTRFARIKFAGTLNERIKVFVDMMGSETVLVGYKSADTDCGYVLSPYVLVMSMGMTINPLTFQPVASLMTRYGKNFDESGRDYYITLKVSEPTS